MKKILVDARSMASNPSGIGMYLYNFLKELVNYKNFKLILITDVIESNEIKYFKKLNIDIVSYGTRVSNNFKVFSYFKFIKKQISKLNPDIFWEPNFIIPINLNFNGKTIITIHDIFPITHKPYYNFKYIIYFNFFLRKTLKQVDHILYDSKTTKHCVENWNSKTKKIKNSVTYVIINRDNVEVKNIDKNYFIYIGNIEKRKGIDLLIDSYNMYREKGGINKLYIIGKLKDKKLKKKIENSKNIKYYGYINKNKKNKLLSESSCFIFPSKAEGFGMPVIEAMHYNKPIIASNLEIFKELVGNCINYFELDNNSVNNLTIKMFNYEVCNGEQYKRIINNFVSNKLIKDVIKILEE